MIKLYWNTNDGKYVYLNGYTTSNLDSQMIAESEKLASKSYTNIEKIANIYLTKIKGLVGDTTEYGYIWDIYDECNPWCVFANYDGSKLDGPKIYSLNSIPEYSGETPTRPSTSGASYEFSGWYPEISAITENTVYVAQYTETLYMFLCIDNVLIRWDPEKTIKEQGYTMLCKIMQGCASNRITKITDDSDKWATFNTIIDNVGMNGVSGRISTAYPIGEQGKSNVAYENEYDITDLTKICDEDYPIAGHNYTNSIVTVKIDGVSTNISDQYTFSIQGYTSMYNSDGTNVTKDMPIAGNSYTTFSPFIIGKSKLDSQKLG